MRIVRLLLVACTIMAVSACSDADITAPNLPCPPGTYAGSGC